MYKPEPDSVPSWGLKDQVTPSPVLLTLAANCCCPPCPKVLVVGFTEIVTMAGGVSVTMADADAPPAEAVTWTDCWLVIELGAVYRPDADRVPTGGLNDQLIGDPLLLAFAVNCCCPPGPRVVAVGLT